MPDGFFSMTFKTVYHARKLGLGQVRSGQVKLKKSGEGPVQVTV